MVDSGLTVQEMADRCGIARPTMGNWLRRHGLRPSGAQGRKHGEGHESRSLTSRPTDYAEAMVDPSQSGVDPAQMEMMSGMLRLARDLGMPRDVLQSLQARVLGRPDVGLAPDDTDVIAEMNRARALALSYLDRLSLASAPAKDLVNVVTQLTSSIQLLRGQPTQIMQVEDRRKLDELAVALHAEIKRRGLTIEGEAREV